MDRRADLRGGRVSKQAIGLFEPWEEEDESLPRIYLAVRLSHLSDDERKQVELLDHTVCEAILDVTTRNAEPWSVSVHSPVRRSAPWRGDSLTAEEIYEINTAQIWRGSDALIIIGFRGASLGAGQELAWAAALALPVLYLHPSEDPVSRQLAGATEAMDLTLGGYSSPQELRDLVCRWVTSRRHALSDAPRRRRARALRLAAFQAQLAEAWAVCGEAERAHVVAVTRIAANRIERLASEPHALAAASVFEYTALADALALESFELPFAIGGPELGQPQFEALLNAANEYGWPPEVTSRLYDRASRELAAGGVRRLPLSTIQDWAELKRADER